MRLYLSVLLLISFSSVNAKTFSQCSLARELLRQGFHRHELADWVCLIEAESSYRTHVIGPRNDDGSYDHGLFQINDRYWCKPGYVGGDCRVACEDLRTDDITAASRCAQLIYRKQGFSAWMGWLKKCHNKPLPNLDHCFNCRDEY